MQIEQVAPFLAATPATLTSLLVPLDDELLRWRPAPDEWCIKEIIGHLIDTDARAFADRIRQIAQEDRPMLESWDVHASAVEWGNAASEIGVLLDEFASVRANKLAVLAEVPPARLRRVAVHADGREFSAQDLVYEWVYHDAAHMQQMLGIVRLATLPAMSETMRAALQG